MLWTRTGKVTQLRSTKLEPHFTTRNNETPFSFQNNKNILSSIDKYFISESPLLTKQKTLEANIFSRRLSAREKLEKSRALQAVYTRGCLQQVPYNKLSS